MACLSCQAREELLPVSEPRFDVSEIPGYILSGLEFGTQIVELFCAFRAPEKNPQNWDLKLEATAWSLLAPSSYKWVIIKKKLV